MIQWLLLVVLLALGLLSCAFDRDNPNDLQNPDRVGIAISSDSIKNWSGDSIVIRYTTEGKVDSVCWRFQLYVDSTTSWSCINSTQSDSLVLKHLDDDNYTLEWGLKGDNEYIPGDTMQFAVDNIHGPALYLLPWAPQLHSDSTFTVQLMLEDARDVLGVKTVLRWDTAQIRFVSIESSWKTLWDSAATNTLELASVYWNDSVFTGSGQIANITYKLLKTGSGAQLWVDATNSQASSGNGERLSWKMVRGSILP